jgi:predicted nuclease of predicted toxin-antitoxin system
MITAKSVSISKRPSAANLQKLLESETFFLDRCLGKKILASVLRAATLKIEVHDDHFPPDAKDEDWLQIVGARGWIVLTSDRRIRYRALELTALKASGVRAFTFRSGNLTAQEMGEIFLKALQRISTLLKNNAGPFVASILRDGSVRVVLPPGGK